jgi:aminopeptidase N
MEHQSAVAYGNQYKKGYMGRDLSGTGIGLSFDFITIHETGHEWFGNSITSKDIADMWIHEAFTTYSESVFVECTQSYELAQKYINGQAKNILNDKPVIGFYGVNKEGSGDMYNKGALMLNTLRHITNNDSKWWAMLLKYSNTYKKQIIDTKTVIDFFSQELGHDMTPFFNQYLKYTSIPILVLKKHKNTFKYKWQTDELNFEMPIEIEINGINKRVLVTNEFQISPIQVVSIPDEIKFRTDKYYIKVY